MNNSGSRLANPKQQTTNNQESKSDQVESKSDQATAALGAKTDAKLVHQSL